MTHRIPGLTGRIARLRARRPGPVVTFDEAAGQVCDAACRRGARLDRARTAAVGLGYRI